MFQVVYKFHDKYFASMVHEEEVTVFDIVQNKNGYPNFLIYHDNQWKYV